MSTCDHCGQPTLELIDAPLPGDIHLRLVCPACAASTQERGDPGQAPSPATPKGSAPAPFH